jgi:hypothetical protein
MMDDGFETVTVEVKLSNLIKLQYVAYIIYHRLRVCRCQAGS